MEHTTFAARLRYLDADDVDDAVVNYDGLDVLGSDGGKLGDLDGFIVDASAGRVYYVVIDTAGWFRTKQLLLPIGHAALDAGHRALRVDVTKDALSQYPEFDKSRFHAFTDDDLRQFESRTVKACCPGDETGAVSKGESWAYDSRRHYTQPGWWSSQSHPEPGLGASPVAGAHAARVAERDDRAPQAGRESDREQREEILAREPDDLSPHYGGRAQPGDVLGIETGGERTQVGESPEDENERRRDAEKTVAEGDPPRRSER